MKLYDQLRKKINEMQQPKSEGGKAFKGLHNPIDHTNLVPGVTDQEHIFNGTMKPYDNNFVSSNNPPVDKTKYDTTLTRDDAAKNAGYDSTIGLNKEETEIDEANGMVKPKDLTAKKPEGMQSAKYHKSSLFTRAKRTSQVKTGMTHRFEEVESVEEANQYIEVKNKHTGAVKHIEVHPSKAFAALNQYKKDGHSARIVTKKSVKEEVEQIYEASIMKHFHGEDGDHGGQPTKAEWDHEHIIKHLANTVGTKHEVYHKVSKLLKSAQRAHHLADKHYDNPDKHMDYKDRAHSDESYAKRIYANHLKSQKSIKKEEVEQIDEASKDLLNKIQHHQTSIDALRDKIDQRIRSGGKGGGYNDSDEKELVNHKKQLRKLKLATEDADQIDEVLSKKAPIGAWISDFVHSKNPKFAGKSKKERMKQAMAAYYSKQRNESYVKEDDDWEGVMSKTELSAIRDKADKLIGMINDSDELEAWVQSKIAYAKTQLDGVYDYMTYSGEHKPSKPADQTSPMAANYTNFMNRMGEEYVVEKKGDDEDESDRAANKNIINQMRKAPVNGMHKITFENGKKHMIDPKHVARALEVHANTPVAKGAKEELQNALGRSHEDFMHVVKHGKAPMVKPKPKVSLGTMRNMHKEDVRAADVKSKRPQLRTTASGKLEVINASPSKSSIKVEELKGNQSKIDANHNGKIDGQDFKLLRMRKKKVQEAEEMTAANVAKQAATQKVGRTAKDANMQSDSLAKINKDPLAKKTNEEIDTLDRLFDTLSEDNRAKFRKMIQTEEGLDYLLNFAMEQEI